MVSLRLAIRSKSQRKLSEQARVPRALSRGYPVIGIAVAARRQLHAPTLHGGVRFPGDAGECSFVQRVLICNRCDRILTMTPRAKKLVEQLESWPEEDQEELVEYAREIEARHTGEYHSTPEELEAIDEALGEVARGEVASKEEIEAAF